MIKSYRTWCRSGCSPMIRSTVNDTRLNLIYSVYTCPKCGKGLQTILSISGKLGLKREKLTPELKKILGATDQT